LKIGANAPDKDRKDKKADDSGKTTEILSPPLSHIRNAVIEKTKKQQ